jgi:hypothetical protein
VTSTFTQTAATAFPTTYYSSGTLPPQTITHTTSTCVGNNNCYPTTYTSTYYPATTTYATTTCPPNAGCFATSVTATGYSFPSYPFTATLSTTTCSNGACFPTVYTSTYSSQWNYGAITTGPTSYSTTVTRVVPTTSCAGSVCSTFSVTTTQYSAGAARAVQTAAVGVGGLVGAAVLGLAML